MVEQKTIKAGENVTAHKQNYFELVFIEEGTGFHIINDVKIPYHEMNIFLLAPEDVNFAEITQDTTVTLVRFTELMFSGNSMLPDRAYWLTKIEHILHHPNLMPGDCLKSEEDRERVWWIKELLVKEFREQKEFYFSIISNTIATILSIIARNIALNFSMDEEDRPTVYINRADEILSYIRKNIYNTELMKIENLADKFNMSANYINNFFKKETGESIRQYILNYKLLITEFRLKNTNSPISEIAFQVGFNDESHLSKAFRKKHNMTPKEYRDKNSIEHGY